MLIVDRLVEEEFLKLRRWLTSPIGKTTQRKQREVRKQNILSSKESGSVTTGGKGNAVCCMVPVRASSAGNWKAVLEPLSQRYQVFAMDLIGLASVIASPRHRTLITPYGPGRQAMLARIEREGCDRHSLAGSLALTLASRHPTGLPPYDHRNHGCRL